jgi:uncharacterized protein YdhG (YjbR/CyaY superfamily)
MGNHLVDARDPELADLKLGILHSGALARTHLIIQLRGSAQEMRSMKRTGSARHVAGLQGRKLVDAYLAAVPPDARKALKELRATIKAAVPAAEEGLSYGLPAFRLDGRPLVCYSAAKAHCSFFPMSPAVIQAHKADLKAYATSKGTIRFGPGESLPPTLVRKLVKARMAELQAPAIDTPNGAL